MIRKVDAIISLVPNAEVIVRGDEVEWIKEPLNKPSDAEINLELLRLQDEYDAKQYQRDRDQAYPSIADQLDYIYHNGIDAWKTDMIDPVKNKYPKG